MRPILAGLLLGIPLRALAAQAPAPAPALPALRPAPTAIAYRVRIDTADLSRVEVTMEVRGGPRALRVAMARDPEYDDRWWRYVRDLTIESGGGPVAVTRADSATWRADLPDGNATIRYRLAFPETPVAVERPRPRGAWKPALTASGGALGGPDTFLYLPGHESAPAYVTVEGGGAGWQIATGLRATNDPRTFYAPDAATLLDGPLLVGRLWSRSFTVRGVPHRVVYLAGGESAAFDTAAFVDGIAAVVRQAIDLFGGAPYPDYTFLVQDGAEGGLEHATSLTLGAESAILAKNAGAFLPQIAHEYFHTWNLVGVKPADWGGGRLTTAEPPRTTGLWWSEGVTLYFADVLMRRAGLRDEATARDRLAQLLGAFLTNPGYRRISPERASWTTSDPSSVNDGYLASHYTQGELFGNLLDVVIRDSTGMRRGLDDAMREIYRRHGGARGFTSEQLERAVSAACGCNLHGFFRDHVRAALPLDATPFLASLGWRAELTREAITDSTGTPRPDPRTHAVERVRVRLEDLAPLTPRQTAMRRHWLRGDSIPDPKAPLY